MEDGPGRDVVELQLEQALHRSQAERRKRHPRQPIGREGPLEPERHRLAPGRALGEQEPDTVVPEAARREAQHGRGRRVEPLDVIDGHDHRRLLGQRPENAQGGKGDHLLGRCLAVVGEQQGGLERASLRARQPSAGLVLRANEIPERSVREARLRLSGARAESNHARLARTLERRVPDGRLACPGLALDDHRLRAGWDRIEEPTDAQ